MWAVLSLFSALLAATGLAFACVGDSKKAKVAKQLQPSSSKEIDAFSTAIERTPPIEFPPGSFEERWMKEYPDLCGTQDSSKDSSKEMHADYMNYSLSLFQTARSTNENCVLSPTSLALNLVLLMEGATGRTLDEIKKMLGMNADLKTIRCFFKAFVSDLNFLYLRSNGFHSTARVANGLFVSKGIGIDNDYARRVKNDYEGTVETLDFADSNAATEGFNSFLRNRTNGLIGDIEPSGRFVDSIAILINAVFFKGTWASQFDERETKSAPFNGISGVREMPFMKKGSFVGKYSISDMLKGVQLNFVDSTYSMLLLMPNGDFGKWLASLTAAMMDTVMNGMSIDGRSITLSIPKFAIHTEIDGKEALKKLGVGSCFEANGDLRGISKDASLRVDNCIQKAVIKVDEKGTTAFGHAAAFCLCLPQNGQEEITFDAPFLFLVLRGNSPILIGQVV